MKTKRMMKQIQLTRKILLFYLLLLINNITKSCHGLQAPVYSSLVNKLGLSSSSSDVSKSTPIKKVAIIGSGICGLSLAHALENSESCAKPYLDALFSSTRDSSRSTDGSSRKGELSPLSSPFGIETFIFDSRSSLNFETGAGENSNI